MNKREKKSYAKALESAEKLLGSENLDQFIEKAEARATRHVERFSELWVSIQTILEMGKAWARREYKNVPKKTMLSVLAAIIYFVNPFDAIPDFLASFGFLDDAAVFAFVIHSLRGDLQKFREWQNQKNTAMEE
ncbi:DUF1232 domain-containing protein [candidate division KSB1 bacterium]|nr:DUF1232 domain-containing protein [candidate division KSB1 bacterium]